MHAAPGRQASLSLLPPPTLAPGAHRPLPALPAAVGAALWRGHEVGGAATPVLASGWAALDAELPGGGWPCQATTEILLPQSSVTEWRLLGPVLARVAQGGAQVVVVGPPKPPHLPGLRHAGLDERRLVWLKAETPAERLWTTEQLVKSDACGAIVAWLPQARPEQVRRLQVCAQGCAAPVFLFRPDAARHESSPAPLRVQVTFGLDWVLQVQLLKRRGPVHEGVIELPSIPGGLQAVLTPRLRQPSRLLAAQDALRPTPAPAPAPTAAPALAFARGAGTTRAVEFSSPSPGHALVRPAPAARARMPAAQR